MNKKMVSIAAGLLVAVPVLLTGCQGDSGTAVGSSETVSEMVSSAVSGSEVSAVSSVPEPFTAADNTFSVMLPDGFVEQSTDPASGTTIWVHPQKAITLTATSVKQGLQPDSLTQEAMAQTLSVTYEEAEIVQFEQKPKNEGTLFIYEANVMQNGQKNHLIQALYADADQTITLAMTLKEGQEAEGRAMMDAMTESLKAL